MEFKEEGFHYWKKFLLLVTVTMEIFFVVA